MNFKRSLRTARPFLFILAAFAVAFVMQPRFPGRSLASLFDPVSSLPPRETTIALEPVSSPVLRGTPVTIRAKASGFVPDRLALKVRPETGREVSLDMASEGNGLFVHRIDSIAGSIRYMASSGRAQSQEYVLEVADPPDVAGVVLTLTPPAYSRLPREVREGGHIEALKGTVVNLEARATKPLKAGRLLLNRSEQVGLRVAGRNLRATLLVLTPGSYSLVIEDKLGFGNADPIEYGIRLLPDDPPGGEISLPAEELEVLGIELIPLQYTARDDFGVTSVSLLYETPRVQGSIALKRLVNSRSVGPQAYDWDLEDLALVPGDRVSFRLEVRDNDSISGPKAGYSGTYTLKVRDEKEDAAGESERAREIADALLDLLADQLEHVKNRKELSDEMSRILEKVDGRIERMGAQSFERFDLEALKRNIESLKGRIHDIPEETATREIERLNLLAEGLADRARMNEAEALSREIRNRQRRLVDEMRNLEGSLAKGALRDLLKELEALRDLLSRMMEALSDAASPLPDELAGRSDVEGFDSQEMFDDLEEIERRLAEGDTEGALETARKMLDALSDMLAAMSSPGAQDDADSLGRLGSDMNRQAGELEKILGEQKEVLQGTESLAREFARALAPNKSGSGAETGSSPEGDALEKLREAGREKFRGLSSRQERLEERTGELAEKLELLSQLFPGMDASILEDLRGAAESMKGATGNLRREDAPGAIPPEEEAIRGLSRAQQGLQQGAQRMGREQAMRLQAERLGYPWGYDRRPGWYSGSRIPMPTLPQPETRTRREEGRTGIDTEEFELPSRDAYKAPPNLREQIMEALKEDIPPQYRRDVERYFRGLTE